MSKEDATGIARKPLNYNLQMPPGHFGLQAKKGVTVLATVIDAHKQEVAELLL